MAKVMRFDNCLIDMEDVYAIQFSKRPNESPMATLFVDLLDAAGNPWLAWEIWGDDAKALRRHVANNQSGSSKPFLGVENWFIDHARIRGAQQLPSANGVVGRVWMTLRDNRVAYIDLMGNAMSDFWDHYVKSVPLIPQ